jgi:EpsI family protein
VVVGEGGKMRQVQKYAVLLAGILILWLAVQASVKPVQGGGKVIEDFHEIPLQVGQWSGVEQPFDDVSKKALPYSALLSRDYENERGYDSNLSIVYGVDLGGFHQPEYCMEGSGWKRNQSRVVKVNSASPHDAVILNMYDGYSKIVVLYWFATEGTTTTVLGKQKVAALMGRIAGSKMKPAAMIRLITPIVNDVKSAEELTLDLAATLDPYINKTLAKPPVFEDRGKAVIDE